MDEKAEEKLLKLDPRPQRLLRLNRRGFYMSGHVKQNTKSEKDNGIANKTDSPSKNAKSEKTYFERLSSSSKVIKLIDSKKVSNSGTDTAPKRSLNGEQAVTNSQKNGDQETPPKKKHKPITWP